jgi:hypothetical protein
MGRLYLFDQCPANQKPTAGQAAYWFADTALSCYKALRDEQARRLDNNVGGNDGWLFSYRQIEEDRVVCPVLWNRAILLFEEVVNQQESSDRYSMVQEALSKIFRRDFNKKRVQFWSKRAAAALKDVKKKKYATWCLSEKDCDWLVMFFEQIIDMAFDHFQTRGSIQVVGRWI